MTVKAKFQGLPEKRWGKYQRNPIIPVGDPDAPSYGQFFKVFSFL